MYKFAERYASDAGMEATNRIEEMTELSVVVPDWQAEALVDAAHRAGLSAAQFLRRILGQALQGQIKKLS